MRLKFKTTNKGNDKIPLIDVIITNIDKGIKVAYPALVDSGAFMSVFHTGIAGVLGIDLDSAKEIEFGGVGNKKKELRGKLHIVNILVAKSGQNHSFDALVLFSDDIDPNGEPLLGRMGFMDQFSKVEFSLMQERFYLYK